MQRKKEVAIAMAWFTNERLLAELIKCLKKNIDVNLILLDSPINWMPYAPDFNDFISAGGKMFIADSSVGFMHHKFCVIDGNLTITGSYNWTHYAETRNIENIVVSDEQSLSASFLDEFSRIKNKLSRLDSAPRLSWEEIESSSNVNVDELNCELHEIANARSIPEYVISIPHTMKVEKKSTGGSEKVEALKPHNAPVSQSNKTETVIQVLDKPKIAKASTEIGIKTDDSNWMVFINEGQELPFQYKSPTMFVDNSDAQNSRCFICFKNKSSQFGQILDTSLKDIVNGCSLNSNINLKVTLDKNGYLHIEITSSSGKTIDASCINPDLVIWEK